MAIDSKHAFIAMEEVVSNNGVKLVVNVIVGRKAVVNAAIGNIHFGSPANLKAKFRGRLSEDSTQAIHEEGQI